MGGDVVAVGVRSRDGMGGWGKTNSTELIREKEGEQEGEE